MNRIDNTVPNLHDAARRRAGELRNQAMDAAWQSAFSAARHAARSAARFAARLARHRRLRGAARA